MNIPVWIWLNSTNQSYDVADYSIHLQVANLLYCWSSSRRTIWIETPVHVKPRRYSSYITARLVTAYSINSQIIHSLRNQQKILKKVKRAGVNETNNKNCTTHHFALQCSKMNYGLKEKEKYLKFSSVFLVTIWCRIKTNQLSLSYHSRYIILRKFNHMILCVDTNATYSCIMTKSLKESSTFLDLHRPQ